MRRSVDRLTNTLADAQVDRAARELDAKKETLVGDGARRLERQTEERDIFTIRWCIA
jgi:hypothetical protein